jgi:hypothetical protein
MTVDYYIALHIMSKALWACSVCGEDFTRRSSAERHSNNVHQGRSILVRFVEYLSGRASGLYPRPIDPPRIARRGRPQFGKTSKRNDQTFTTSDRTVTDSTIKDFWWDFGKDTKNDRSHKIPSYSQLSSNQSNNDRHNPIDEAISNATKLVQLETLVNKLSIQSAPFDLPVIPARMNIPKPVGFRAEFCDTCLLSTIDPIFSFNRLDSAVKTVHSCNSQALNMIQNRTDIADFSTRSRELITIYLADIVSSRVGSEPIFLIAEELRAPCSKLSVQYYAGKILPQYILSELPVQFSRERVLSKDPYIDLGKVGNNHWARRANTGQEYKTILNMDELFEFLNLAKSTFGAFQVELEDGMQRYLLLHINLP